jgi:hypothetical protein
LTLFFLTLGEDRGGCGGGAGRYGCPRIGPELSTSQVSDPKGKFYFVGMGRWVAVLRCMISTAHRCDSKAGTIEFQVIDDLLSLVGYPTCFGYMSCNEVALSYINASPFHHFLQKC